MCLMLGWQGRSAELEWDVCKAVEICSSQCEHINNSGAFILIAVVCLGSRKKRHWDWVSWKTTHSLCYTWITIPYKKSDTCKGVLASELYCDKHCLCFSLMLFHQRANSSRNLSEMHRSRSILTIPDGLFFWSTKQRTNLETSVSCNPVK